MKKIVTIIIILFITQMFSSNILENEYFDIEKNKFTDGVFITPSVFVQKNIQLKSGDLLKFKVSIPEEGLYNIKLKYKVLNDSLEDNELSVKINGEYQFFEARRIILPQFWMPVSKKFNKDRYGNDLLPEHIKYKIENTYVFRDPAFIEEKPLYFYFSKGENEIELKLENGSIEIYEMNIISNVNIPKYEDYLINEGDSKNVFIKIEAEKYDYKNDTAINPVVSRDLEVEPYSTNNLLLNVFGGDTWAKSGKTVYYKVQVPQDGYYLLGVKYLQKDKPNMPVYREIYINDEIPFKEFDHVKFEYNSNWNIKSFDYKIYLNKGENIISFETDSTIYGNLINMLIREINSLNDLSLSMKKLIGQNNNQYIEWEVKDYFPDIDAYFKDIKRFILNSEEKLLELGVKKNSQPILLFEMALRNVDYFIENINKIPQKYSLISEGENSIVKYFSLILNELKNQPLLMDQIYVYSPGMQLPEKNISLNTKIMEFMKRFINSFLIKKKEKIDKDYITVWVNRSRNYIELMQRLADNDFTPKTGIKVKFSLMPNEQKLILANAAKITPDVAIGISNWLPFEMGIRGAVLDLRQFEDFPEIISNFSPGALLLYIYQEKCFGLPETQDFYVLFYRKDILDSLKIPIPETWEDVKNIIPELQRYGLNFYIPLSGSGGLKPFMFTTPFIFQTGGELYSKDGFSTTIDSLESIQGIKLMTELYTLYGVPLQVPNFFEKFKNGTLPIGISNLTTYIQLLVAAPELANSWDIALSPGIERNGEIYRWQAGSAQSVAIFNNTKSPEKAWEFIKWWLSEKTQANFSILIETLYGKEFFWNSANLKAFKQNSLPKEHKKVILEQWKWLREPVKTPASYILEREISNIWTKVVFEGKNLRASIDESVIKVNKEFSRKLEEFGYIKNGKKIKEYIIPDIQTILNWGNYNEK